MDRTRGERGVNRRGCLHRRLYSRFQGEPGVAEDVLQGYPILGPDLEATADKVTARVGDGSAEVDFGGADLVIGLEGDVALDHVEEKDAETPHGGGSAEVAAAGDPLRRGVHTGSWNNKTMILSIKHFVEFFSTDLRISELHHNMKIRKVFIEK